MEYIYGDDPARVDALIRRIFSIDDTTLGDERSRFVVRFRGRLVAQDSAEAYAWLADQLKFYNLTPLFRVEEGRQVILLLRGVENPRPSNPRINLLLFLLTLISVWFTGGILGTEGELPQGIGAIVLELLTKGWPFAVSMIAILAAHEFGHYLVGRHHGVHVTLPYFLPLPYPFSPFGTMGAFINMKESPRNRRILLDIGLAGPISGLVVAIPVVLIGLSLSNLDPLPAAAAASGFGQLQLEGNSILYLILKFIVFGEWLPAPASYDGIAPILYWARYLFTGQPLPYAGLDVSLHPVAWAGWAGILITSLNLIPAGQLDGGHILYTLLGPRNAKRALPIILAALVILGFFWSGWWFWAFLIFLLGRAHAEPLDQITRLDSRRKILGILALIVFILVFTPVPLMLLM